MKDVPGDYYRRLAEVDDGHWWTRGMLELDLALLRPWLEREPHALLDAGCGTGAFLVNASRRVPSAALYGVDLSPEAIGIAHGRVPTAELSIAPLSALPFADASFDVVVANDVLQHIDESELSPSLAEVRRVLAATGAFLVRTNGARRGRRERSDWRLYDRSTLRAHLEQGGFSVRRITYANFLFSLVAELRRRGPRAPTGRTCGIPAEPGAIGSALGRATLGLETVVISRHGHVPWGHTLVAVAVPR